MKKFFLSSLCATGLIVGVVAVCAIWSRSQTSLMLGGSTAFAEGEVRTEEETDSIETLRDLVKAHIQNRDMVGAEAACQDLCVRFSADPALPSAILDIARAYRAGGYYPQARVLCHRVIQDYPGWIEALRARAELAFVERSGGSNRSLAIALDSLKAAFAPASAAPETILEVARVYREFRRFDDARTLHNYLIENRPGAAEAPLAWADLAIIESRVRNAAAAAAARDALKAAFDADPSLGSELNRLADDYLDRALWADARDLCEHLLLSAPAADLAVEALCGLGRSAVGQKDRSAFESVVDALRGSYGTRPRAAFSQFEIGKQCRKAGWNSEAFSLWRDITTRWPDDPYAFWSQLALVTENIALKNEADADAAVERLFAVFHDHRDLPGRVNHLAKVYMDRGGSEKGVALSRRLLQIGPSHPEAIWAQSQLVEAHARLGNATAADEALSILLDQYREDPRLSNVYFQIARRLFKGEDLPSTQSGSEVRRRARRRSEAARPYLEGFLQRWPGDRHALSAWSDLAIARLWMGDEAGEDAAVHKLLSDFAAHRLLYASLLRIAEQRISWALEPRGNPERGRRFRRADDLLGRIRSGYPDPEDLDINPRACFLLARSAYYQGREQECIRLCEESFSRWPGYNKQRETWLLAFSAYSALARRGAIVSSEAAAARDALKTALAADPSLGDEVEGVADGYLNRERWEEARDLYQYLLSSAPSDHLAIKALCGLGRSAVGRKDRAAMQSAVQEIQARFPRHWRAPLSQFEIGKQCREAGWNPEAFALWQDITTRWPDGPYAFWAQLALATENIALGNGEVADAAIERLFSDFRDVRGLPGRINALTRQYLEKNLGDKAVALSRKMLETWPSHTGAIWAQAYQVEAHARLGNSAAADEAFAALLDKYRDDRRLGNVYFQVAHRLFKGEDLPHTIKIPERARRAQVHSAAARPFLENFLERWPDDPNALWAWSQTAIARLWAGEEAGEEEAVNKLFADFAQHRLLFPALLRVAEQRILLALMAPANPERDRRFARAIELLVRIRAGHPHPEDVETNPRACFLLAYSAYHQRRWEDCLRFCEESFVGWPDYGKQYEARILAASAYSILVQTKAITAEQGIAAVQRLYDKQAADTKAPPLAYYRNEIAKALKIIRDAGK